VIPSNQTHESDLAVPLIATFWLEPDTGDARRVAQPQGEFRLLSVERSKLSAIVPRLLESWNERSTSQRAAALMEEVVQILAPSDRPLPVIDQRVTRAVEFLASAPDRRVSLATAAAAVSLSPSRLAHLFTPAVGIPPRRYLLWLRLRDAVQALAGGASITHAAHAAGFADAPHLTRTFRRMLGFTPSAALHVSKFVQDAPARR
jgi:AraC-like DNA-binding protein